MLVESYLLAVYVPPRQFVSFWTKQGLIAVFTCCDLCVPARRIPSRATVVALHTVRTAMQLFYLEITREHGILTMSPVIVVK